MLDHSSQMQWKALWRKEAKALEIQGLKQGFEVSQDKIFGKWEHADSLAQA